MTKKKAEEKNPPPRHVAIIMDGNGRWAKQHHLPRLEGHRRGINAVRETVRVASEMGVGYLTLYAFSVENWRRPQAEVGGLMELLAMTLLQQLGDLKKLNVRLRAIGRLDDLPAKVRRQLEESMKETSKNTGMTLVLALSYGSRVELTEAVKKIATKVKEGKLQPEKIDEELVQKHLYTTDIPDPDLLIRTSGEMRLSNFLLWQMSYTEIYITPVLWPDFGEKDFRLAVQEYSTRHRRFGGI